MLVEFAILSMQSNRQGSSLYLLLSDTCPFLKGEDTILSFLLSFLSSSLFSRPSNSAIRLNASARVARRQTISSLCAKDCLSRSATRPNRDPVSHSNISSVKGNSRSNIRSNNRYRFSPPSINIYFVNLQTPLYFLTFVQFCATPVNRNQTFKLFAFYVCDLTHF